jgi:hypothetical protein
MIFLYQDESFYLNSFTEFFKHLNPAYCRIFCHVNLCLWWGPAKGDAEISDSLTTAYWPEPSMSNTELPLAVVDPFRLF